MKLTDFDTVQELKTQLAHADRVLQAFRNAPGQTVTVTAHSMSGGDYGRACTVALLPVAKEVAVSSAERERSKIVAQLLQLGVEVD